MQAKRRCIKQHADLSIALVPAGPLAPAHMAFLASIFLLRVIEASTATTSAWMLDDEAIELTWSLSASKTDQMALGTKRNWGCLCDLPGFFCPYHLAVEHMQWLRSSPVY